MRSLGMRRHTFGAFTFSLSVRVFRNRPGRRMAVEEETASVHYFANKPCTIFLTVILRVYIIRCYEMEPLCVCNREETIIN